MEIHGSGTIVARGVSEKKRLSGRGDGDEDIVTLTARLGATDPKWAPRCKEILDKATTLLHFHSKWLINKGFGPSQLNSMQAVGEALTLLKKGQASGQSLELLMAGIGNVSLSTALQAGEVWTATDQSDFNFFCFPGLTPFRQLEEKNPYVDVEDDEYQAIAEPRIFDEDQKTKRVIQEHEVYYCYRVGTSNRVKRAFVAARKHIEEQVPCLKFKAIKPESSFENCTVAPSIQVRDQPNGCWTAYQPFNKEGQKPKGTVWLNVGRGCEMKGMIAHLLTKVLGMKKETVRIDRDKYLDLHLERLRMAYLQKFFKKRTVPPPEDAYASDPFDFLSISMLPAQAFTDGLNSVEPSADPHLAHFLGQRLGLSELDATELGDRFDCRASLEVANPTRVISENFLKGEGLNFDGSCRDQENVAEDLRRLLKNGRHRTCGEVTTEDCRGPAGGHLQTLCASSCLACVPATASLVKNKNQIILRAPPKYCDDAGCESYDPQGTFCKGENPDALQIKCPASHDEYYCDDAGCESPDPSGKECQKKNPAAKQIPCAVPSISNHTPSVPALHASDGCVDAINTGIKFREGPKATCHDLKGYCGHKVLGERVLKACPATCNDEGYKCDPALAAAPVPERAFLGAATGEAAGNKSNATTYTAAANSTETATNQSKGGCQDKDKNDKPLLMVHGVAQTCEQIRSYCIAHSNSEMVQEKCPVTCGACVPEVPEPKVESNSSADLRSESISSADANNFVATGLDVNASSTTTAYQFQFSTPMPDADATGVGCERRRRWGFCYTRRRRDL